MKTQLKKLLNHTWFFPVLMLYYGVFYILFGEKYPLTDGMGTDGYVYYTFVALLNKSVFFDSYYVHRIFPSLLVRGALDVFSLELIPKNVVMAFEILNLICIVVAMYYVKKTLIFLNIQFKNQLLAFLLLIVNFAILKWAFYFPVMTDTVAFTLCVMLLYFYFKNNYFGLIIIAFLLAFTWTMAFYQALILIAIPYQKINFSELTKKRKIGISIASIFYYLTACFCIVFVKKMDTTMELVPKINQTLLPLSIVSVGFLFVMFSKLFFNAELFNLKAFFSQLKIFKIISAILIFVFVFAIIYFLHPKQTTFYPTSSMLMNPFVYSLIRPMHTLVSHFAIFGFSICLLILFWNEIAKTISKMGWGLVMAIALNIYLYAIMPESRSLINLFPLMIIVFIKAINKFSFSNLFYILVAIFSFISSKIWLIIDLQQIVTFDKNGTIDFPNQRFYLNLGPWMSNEMYYLQGLVMIVFSVVLFFVLYRIKKSEKTVVKFERKF